MGREDVSVGVVDLRNLRERTDVDSKERYTDRSVVSRNGLPG